MNYSLMTTSMVFPLVSKLQTGSSMEEIKADYAGMLSMVAHCGIPAVEITSLELDVFGLDTVQKALSDAGLLCSCVIHMDVYAETSVEKRDRIVTNACQKILDAKALGASYIMLALMAQPDVEKYSSEELRQALICNIRPIAEYGKAKGITVSVEDTPDIRLPLCSSAEIGHILDAVPELSLTYDTGNMLLKNEDSVSFYNKLKERVVYVHLKDMEYTTSTEGSNPTIDGRHMSATLHGQGVLNFGEILASLKKGRYDGFLMLEYTGMEKHAENIRAAKGYIDAQLPV